MFKLKFQVFECRRRCERTDAKWTHQEGQDVKHVKVVHMCEIEIDADFKRNVDGTGMAGKSS